MKEQKTMGVAVKRDQWQILKHIVRKNSNMKIRSLIKNDLIQHVCTFHIF